MLAVSLAACSSQNTAPSQNSAATGDKKAAPAFNLKMQSFQVGVQYERTLPQLVDQIEKQTNGTVKIKPYPAGGLFPVKEMLDALRTGAVDMVLIPESYFAGAVPVSEIAAGMPYGYQNLHEAWIFMWHRGFVDILREEYAKQNAYVIPWETYNVGLMTNKPINRVEDLKGKKLRATSGLGNFLTEAGSSVVMIPANELYTAISTGVVDGACWGDAGPMHEMKFQEVLKNYMQPDPVQGGWNSVLINMDVWNKFTPDQKRAVEAAVISTGRVIQEQTRAMYDRALNDMVKNHGVVVNKLSGEEQAKAREVAIRSWEVMAKKNPQNAKVINMLKDFQKEYQDAGKVIPPVKMPW